MKEANRANSWYEREWKLKLSKLAGANEAARNYLLPMHFQQYSHVNGGLGTEPLEPLEVNESGLSQS